MKTVKCCLVLVCVIVLVNVVIRNVAMRHIAQGISLSDKIVCYNSGGVSQEMQVDAALRAKMLKIIDDCESFSFFNFTKMAHVSDLEFFDEATNLCLRIRVFDGRCLMVNEHKIVVKGDIVDACGFTNRVETVSDK